jgi:DNA-binding transcriptional LysR family regulator
MNFTQITYFLTTVKCRSFTQAANLLYITQPALSRQIMLMEKELDFKLFYRSNRSLNLTPAGYILAQQFENLLRAYDNALHSARNTTRNFSGTLLIGILDGMNIDDIIICALRSMSEKYSLIDIALFNFGFEELANRLYDGRLDLAFTKKYDADHRNDLNYIVAEKATDYVALPADDRLANKEFLDFSMIADRTLSVVTEFDHDRSLLSIKEEFDKIGVAPKIRPSPSFNANLLWIKAGMGISIIDDRCYLPSEGITLVPFVPFRDPSVVLANYNNNFNPSRTVFEEIIMDIACGNEQRKIEFEGADKILDKFETGGCI